MLRSPKKYLFTYLLVCVLLCNSLVAQEKGFYDGPFKVHNYKGKAAYGYEYDGNDTVLNGSFAMQSSNLEALLNNKDSTFLIDGTFEKGNATGFWKFRFGVFEAKPESSVVDYEYRISASGEQEEAQGLMVAGKPEGSWNYTVQSIKDAQIVKTLFKSTITFENGIPQQNIRIENDSTVLVGRFLRNGMAQDEWVLYAMDEPKPTERWFFNNGILEKIVVQLNQKELTLSIFESAAKETKEVALDLRFLKVLEARLGSVGSLPLATYHVAELLSQNQSYYDNLDTILTQLGNSGLSPNFRVRLPYYPKDSLAKTYVLSIVDNISRATEVTDAYLDNPLLNILKLTDVEALGLYTALENINNSQLVPLQKLRGYQQYGLLEFLTNGDILRNLWPEGIDTSIGSEMEQIAKSTGFDWKNKTKFDFQPNTMESIAALAQYTADHAAHIETELKEKLSKQLREQERIALDEQLLAQNKQLARFIDSVGTTLPIEFQKALVSIQKVTVINISTVSTNEDVALAKAMVSCHEQMYQLALSVAAQPGRTAELSTLYEDRIWNPFMATLMDEAVKKRITSAYRKVLIPYFLEQINTALSCDNAGEIKLLLDSVYNRMLEFREEDTKKLERKLRKETDALKIQELFRLKVEEKNWGE